MPRVSECPSSQGISSEAAPQGLQREEVGAGQRCLTPVAV